MNGICLCGCGGKTKPAGLTNKNYGWIKGQPNKYIKGHNCPWLGKKRKAWSKDYKIKQRNAHLGREYNMTESGRKILRRNMKKAQRESCFRRPITSLELSFQKIIDDNKLPYRFVGNGEFIIDGLNPDFINVNGEKIAIEVYSRYYKEKDWGSIENYQQKRIERLSVFGWKLYFFDQSQINPEIVLAMLGSNSD